MSKLQEPRQLKRGRHAVRPDIRSWATQTALVDRMIACHDSIHLICMDPTIPSRSDLYAELARNRDFRTSSSRARAIRMKRLCDEVLNVAT